MGNAWLKIKVWTKGIIVTLLVAYALLFIYNNSGQPVTFWYWFGRAPTEPMLLLIGCTFLAGVIGALVVRMTFTTMRQIKELRLRNRMEKIERDQATIKAKAAMLQTRTAPPSAERAFPVQPLPPTDETGIAR